jgi:pyruvate formate lyase activating enzyme
MDEEGVVAFLKARVRFLDGVVVSGGEPTILPDLPDFLKRVKALGYSLKLDTNGSRPDLIQRYLERNLVDYVALDLKSDPSNYPPDLAPPTETQGIQESIRVLKRLRRPHEYRTTAASPFVDDEAVLALARAAAGEHPLYFQAVDQSRGVFNPAFMADYPFQPGPEDLIRFRDLARRYLPCYIR